ncbi:hypothetical protein QR680_010679 [Steinernema hermaphroditum]|uniref:Uncharacterized protein n=1 Tax=Steinernema hermaphroditum TaxID=289476 RepID=A0AA39IPS0_9BILA|nr:hypothetical protein QR680_010679 [Steinernema hermaphroditum]
MNTLFNFAAYAIIRSKEAVDVNTFPQSVKTGLRQLKSMVDFDYIFGQFATELIPDRFFVFKKNGDVDARRTIENAADCLYPSSRFLYYVGTVAVDKLKQAWERCDESEQDYLLQAESLLVAYFAELCDSGHPNPRYSMAMLYIEAHCAGLDDLAFFFYEKADHFDRASVIGFRLEKTLKAEDAEVREQQCGILRKFLTLKNFTLRAETVAFEVQNYGEALRSGFFSLPKDCQIPEFADYLMSRFELVE